MQRVRFMGTPDSMIGTIEGVLIAIDEGASGNKRYRIRTDRDALDGGKVEKTVWSNRGSLSVVQESEEEQAAREKAQQAAQQEAANTASQRVRDFAQAVLEGLEHPHSIVIQVATAQKRDKVLAETGVDIGQAREILVEDSVVHSRKDHPSLTLDDWAMLPEIAETFTEAHRGREKGDPNATRLVFVKRGKPKDYAYIAEFASGKKYGERLRVITFFKASRKGVDEFLAKNKKDEDQPSTGTSPGVVSKTPRPATSSASSVAQPGEKASTSEDATGHAQPLFSLVLTPSGYRQMGDLAVGDTVLAACGEETTVEGIYPQGMQPVFRVITDDGTEALATADHLWRVREEGEGQWKTVPTSVLIAGTRAGRRYELPGVGAL